jgi:hypothetical protein
MMSDPTQGTSIARPDPAVLRVIRPSAARLTQLEDVFTEQLQYEIGSLIPDLAEDDWAFCQRTVQALLWSALTDEPAHVVAGALHRLGAVNQVAGFPDSQYLGLAHALLRAVRELTGDDWSTTLGSAWISYFQWIQRHLMIGAQQAPRPAAPPTPRPAAPPTPRPAPPAHAAGPPPGGLPQPEDGEPEPESVGGPLDDEDDEDTGYGQTMVSMTRNARRDPPA